VLDRRSPTDSLDFVMPRQGLLIDRNTLENAKINQGLFALVLGEFRGGEFAALDVAFVQFRILLPLLGQVV
jgi:hypothetical protein